MHRNHERIRSTLERLAPPGGTTPPGSRTDPRKLASNPDGLAPLTRFHMGTFHSTDGRDTAGCIAGLAITLFPDAARNAAWGTRFLDRRAALAARAPAGADPAHRRGHPRRAAHRRLQPAVPRARTLRPRPHHARRGDRRNRPLRRRPRALAHRQTCPMKNESRPGVLPVQHLRELAASRRIDAPMPLREHQYQPASLDLRLGAAARRLQASFLCGPAATVADKLAELEMARLDLRQPTILERDCIYLVRSTSGWTAGDAARKATRRARRTARCLHPRRHDAATPSTDLGGLPRTAHGS